MHVKWPSNTRKSKVPNINSAIDLKKIFFMAESTIREVNMVGRRRVGITEPPPNEWSGHCTPN